jgi:hypothetical protein
MLGPYLTVSPRIKFCACRNGSFFVRYPRGSCAQRVAAHYLCSASSRIASQRVPKAPSSAASAAAATAAAAPAAAAASPATSAAAATAAATATSATTPPSKFLAELRFGVFLVEDVERRQAHVRNFFLTEKDFMTR